VKRMKNIVERAIAIAMNTGVVAAGAVRRSGESFGSTDKSKVGATEDEVHVTGALLFEREQDPSAPKKTVGPSTPSDDEEFVSCSDGDTTSRATLLWRTITGAVYAKRIRSQEVKARTGAR